MPSPTALEVLEEISPQTDLRTLHPLRLDRWHRALLGLPAPVYMQYGGAALHDQVRQAATGLRTAVELFGGKMPVEPQEVARRTIGSFSWYVPSDENSDLVSFEASWNKETSSWKLGCDRHPDVTKTVASLEEAAEKSREWADEPAPAPKVDADPEIAEEADGEG